MRIFWIMSLILLYFIPLMAADDPATKDPSTKEIAPIAKEGNPAIIWFAKRDAPKIALTFDDGPKPEFSPAILKILDKYGVRGTFFVVGREAKWHPDLIYRMFSTGHEIGNHSYSHTRLDGLTPQQLELEVSATNKIIESITHQQPYFLRPPGGRYNKFVLDIAKKNNLTLAMYDVNAGDFTHSQPIMEIKDEDQTDSGKIYHKPASQIVSDMVPLVQNGSILLFHNGGDQTVQALPEIITQLRKKGFQMVTLSELMRPNSAEPFVMSRLPNKYTSEPIEKQP